MTREQVLNSDSLKRRFIKDCNYPIALTDNPYFMERLVLMNRIDFRATEKFDNFCKMLENFANEQEYFEYYNQMKEAMMEDIKTSEGFKRFNKTDFSHEKKFSKADLYKEYNDGKLFVSIDMRKANFNAVKHFDRSIFEADTWDDFIAHYTMYMHLIESKYIRQVVMGNCNPKHQIQYEDYLMNLLAEHIHNKFPALNIYSVHNDEIIIAANDGKIGLSARDLEEVLASEPNGIGELVKYEIFELHKIKGTDGWEKTIYTFSDPLIQFKCLEAETFNQYIKHYYGLPITENDLVFRHNGKLAKFMKEVDNPWK